MKTLAYFLFGILGLSVASCGTKGETISPETRSITESVYASGFIKSEQQYEVFSRVNGLVEKVFVHEGMQVKKGDPLFQLDSKNSKIATENARLNAEVSDYQRNKNKLRDAEKAIELAHKNLSNDSLLYERQKNLWEQNIGSKVQLEQKQLSYEKAKTDLDKAKTNFQDLKQQLKLNSDQSKNNLEIAELMEDDFIIRSEIDGVVYKINIEEGEMMNSQSPAAVIGKENFLIQLNIDEMDIVKVEEGQQVLLRMDSYKTQVFEARISAINPMMNARTRSFEAEALFTDRPEALYPNLTVEANIVINTKQQALTIPRKYLINDTCVKIKGGALQRVETGLMDYNLVEILGGIDSTSILELPEE